LLAETARWAGMCPRHIASLALVGWYLMTPPSTLPPDLSYKAPLRKWLIVRGFDTADDCEDSRSSFFEESRQKVGLNMLEPAYRDFMFAECVASDDPRLREK
jgi:hypothetical protein